MREVEISPNTFEHLTAHANPGEELGDVIARLLAEATGTSYSPTSKPTFKARPRRHGTLKPFIDSGDFVPGDALHIAWTRLGRELTVTVDEQGKLHTADGQVFTSPSAAGFSVTGNMGGANARFWMHLRSGRTLAWWKEHHETRDDIPAQPSAIEGSGDYLTDPFGHQDELDPH